MTTYDSPYGAGYGDDLDERGAATPSGRHPVNITHLVMGTAFLGVVAVWALLQSGAVEVEHLRWLLPMPWVLAGLAGVLATTSRSRRRTTTTTYQEEYR